MPVLGLDVGGVIIDRVAEGTDTSFFGDRPLETPAVPGALDAIAALVAGPFAGRAVLVSKAGPRTAARTVRWLDHHGFHEVTGISSQSVHFVRKRADKEGVCRRLGVTHFVDDRLSVLRFLVSVPHRYLFSGGLGQHRPPDPEQLPDWVVLAATWPELRTVLTRDAAQPQSA